MVTEHTPLLDDGSISDGPAKDVASRNLKGPLEITASNRRAILAGIWMATFLSSLNTTLVATLVSSISSEYHKSNQGSWLGTSYLLAYCTFTPLYGRLSNVLGRRRANQTAVFFAGLGTLCCGLSTNLEMLIAARFLSGLGGGGCFTTAAVIASDMYSLRDRSLTQGISNIFNGLGTGLGGPLGGYISDRFGWRWAFLVQIPMYVASYILTGYNLHYVTPGKGKDTRDILKRIDYAGSFTLLGSVGSLLLFLSFKYNEDVPWSSPAVLVTLCLFICFFVTFILVELLVAPEPVLAPFLLRKPVPVLIGASTFLISTCNFAVIYHFPMFFKTVMLTSSSRAGLHLLPNSVSMSTGSVFAGWFLKKTGRYKSLNVICGILPFSATVMLTRLSENSGITARWLSIIPLGFGNAVVLQTMFVALMAHVDHSAVAVATGFNQFWRGMGQVSGVAVGSAIFQSLLDRELSKRITGPGAANMVRRIRHSSNLVTVLPPTLQRAARDSYAISLRWVFIFAATSTFLAFLVRVGVPEISLDNPRHTAKVPNNSKANGRTTTPDDESGNAPPSLEASRN